VIPRLIAIALLTAAPKDAPVRDSWLGADKLEHVAASAYLASGAYLFAAEVGGVEQAWKRVLISSGFALGIGAAKELLWDKAFGNGDPSWKDFTADVVGVGLTVGVAYLIDRATR
jgi:putative lipoprotein